MPGNTYRRWFSSLFCGAIVLVVENSGVTNCTFVPVGIPFHKIETYSEYFVYKYTYLEYLSFKAEMVARWSSASINYKHSLKL